jgi:opacity protein-like surface antigen
MNCKEFQPKQALALAMIVFVAFAAIGDFSLPAMGADYEQPFPPPAPTYDMVEFASGWYVRGDIAYAQETFPKIAPSFAVDPLQPPIILPATIVSQSHSPLNSYSAGAGMGYKVNNWFRADLVLDYRSEVQAGFVGPPISRPFCVTDISPDPVTHFPVADAWGRCTPHLNTDIHRWDLLANGYIDLATWQGFTPYIGAGLALPGRGSNNPPTGS